MNLVQELTGTTPTTNLLTGLGIDETFLRTDAAGIQTLLTDGLGSTMALANSSGTLVTQYTYDPFGKTTFTGTASTNAATYTGREGDGTGLYYYRARYYHPVLQRFISEDPIGFGGGDVNLYAYVGNDPVNSVDPDGRWAFFIIPFIPQAALATAEAIAFVGSAAGAAAIIHQATGGEGSSEGGQTPAGRPLSPHYENETGPLRNIPGSIVDNTIDTRPGVPAGNGKTVYYDPANNVTVVTGNDGTIVSVHKGPPRRDQRGPCD